jgi:hypothetical protein
VGSRERKGRKKDGMRAKGRAACFKVGPRAPSSRASPHLHAKRTFRATNCLLAPRPILLNSWNVHLDPERTGTQTETNCVATVTKHGNRENPSRQKSSHLFFVRRSLCQETPNKEGATVITLFLPTGFSRVSARKTGQLGPSQQDPTKPRHIEYSQEEGPGHIFQGLTKFD